jgi:putative transposase
MSNQERQQLSLEFISELYPSGNKKAKYKPSKHHQDKDDTILSPTKENLSRQLEIPLFTPVSVVEGSKKTSKGKSRQSREGIPPQKLSVKLEGDSTSKERNFWPYWNELCQELSEQLLSLTKTDWQDSGSIGLTGSVSNLTAQSWFSTRQTFLQKQKWLKTSLLSSTVSQADCTDLESIKLRSRKIKIYPTPELKKMWNKWMAACRYCFNQAIAYQKENGKMGKTKLRNIIMQSSLPEWVKETPCHIRQNAIFDAHQAYTASKDCKFRNCHAPRQTIKFNNRNFSQGKWYPSVTKGLGFESSEPIPLKNSYATQLIKSKLGEWFAVFLNEVEQAENSSNNIISLDPGVRTFLTGFDGQKFIEIGQKDMGRINRLCSYLDDLMSRISKSRGHQKAKMRKAASKLRTRIRNLVDECHKQTANYLVKNYGIILLPTFETSEMTKKNKRKIRTKTARQMLTWSHYRFKQVLKNKAELSGSKVIDVTEEFTSKTCTRCGHVHQKLGGSKIFKCPECGHTLNRDFNGALGIMLKALSDTTFTVVKDGNAIVVQYSDIPCCTA